MDFGNGFVVPSMDQNGARNLLAKVHKIKLRRSRLVDSNNDEIDSDISRALKLS